MSYRAIISFLLLIILQKGSFAQSDSTVLLQLLHKKIDSIVSEGIRIKAFPGCVVYTSHGENVLIKKAYGYHKYDSMDGVDVSDLYDLASVTKVLASTLALMKLYENGLIDLDKPICQYVKGFRYSKFGSVSLRRALAHQGGFKSWIQFYNEIKTSQGKYKRKTISTSISNDFPFQISQNLYLHKDFYRRLKKMIRKSPIEDNPHYVYSDLFFYLVPEIVDRLTGMKMDEFLSVNFYEPLGLQTLGFNPSGKFELDAIVPTEIDSFFRMELIHGKVHDEGAILMEGLSGNAGLFGNASDVATLLQLLRNGGEWNGVNYLQQATIDLFTTYQYSNLKNRRGLGFDKPLLNYDPVLSSVAASASHLSYGHTGFTGIMVWVDPEYDLIFIFLSNRVYPSRDHKALFQKNIRPNIHQLFYDYIKLKEEQNFDK